jgi:hypothetical protein
MHFCRTRTVCAVVSLAGFILCASHAASAQQDHDSARSSGRYTLADLCGDYAVVGTYGANVARALGTLSIDGHGRFTGSAITNQPGPNGTRAITAYGLAGTYTVNSDGTGNMLVTVTLPSGATPTVTEDFVITRVNVIDGVTIASEIEDAQEVPSAVIDDSSLVVHVYTLRSVPKSCTSGL